MSRVGDHLVIAPIVLPLVAGAVMLLLGERGRTVKAAINVGSTLGLVGIAIAVAALVLSGGFVREVTAADAARWISPSAPELISQKAETLPF